MKYGVVFVFFILICHTCGNRVHKWDKSTKLVFCL